MTTSPIIVALDYADAESALAMARRLSPELCRVKVGKELFTAAGPRLPEQLQAMGFDVFLDLKFHDIPNTVAGAVRAAANLGVWMVNVHASGGARMMEAARQSLDGISGAPLLIAVTVLTSMTAADLVQTGVTVEPPLQVAQLARLSRDCGMDGVVCSARECSMLRTQLGSDFLLVTPGIRPADAAADDQRRIVTPADALAGGSSYLVIGRPVTRSADPAAALAAIVTQIQS
jgi:orotidine-5'-phosphate decarboxylase